MVKELLERIEQRTEFKKELDKFKPLCSINIDRVREFYWKVMEFLPLYEGRIAEFKQEIRDAITNFRFRYLEKVISDQKKQIEDTEKRIKQWVRDHYDHTPLQ